MAFKIQTTTFREFGVLNLVKRVEALVGITVAAICFLRSELGVAVLPGRRSLKQIATDCNGRLVAI